MANAACKTVVGCKVYGDSFYTLAVAMTLFYADKHIARKRLCYNTKKTVAFAHLYQTNRLWGKAYLVSNYPFCLK